MSKVFFGCLLFIVLAGLISTQQINPNGIIETRKLFLFGNNNGFQQNQFGNVYNFLFQQTFSVVPRVGLAVYTMDFQYSPDFSCRITADTNQTSAGILITTTDHSQTNQLYLMYIVTDHDYLGVFMPDPIITDQLNIPSSTSTSINRIQSFIFNFKQQISSTTSISNIRLSVYLTGISTISQMTQNGYPNNRTSFQLQASIQSVVFYKISVVIPNTDGYILIDRIEFTVVYFDVSQMINQRYQIDSNTVTLQNYGGQIQPTTVSIDLIPLKNDARFQNLQFFYGISLVDCKGGPSITLLGVQLYYTTNTTQNLALLLQMQTWRLTYVTESTFGYIQFKSLKCNQPGANCNSSCLTSLKPHYVVNDVCNYCQYSCLTCNVSLKDTVCDTCDPTRTMNSTTNLCVCNKGYYQNYQTYTCPSCFPCATCESSTVCTSCNNQLYLTLNNVKRSCQCQASYFPNYINVTTKTFSSKQPCLKCSQNCLYCLNINTCLACSINTYLTNGRCISICTSQQKYNTNTSKCEAYTSSSFSQEGRLGFDWQYTIQQNQIVVYLTFSQALMAYYYYQNGIGYTYQDYLNQQQSSSTSSSSGSTSSGFYFDDGINQGGYLLESANGNAGIINNGGSSNGGSSDSSGGISTVDQSILNGDYYGYGQLAFFLMLYQNASIQNRDTNGLPYGKYNLSSNSAISNANLVDALSRNLIFTISGDVIPYTLQATSNNTFVLTARPSQTYLGSQGTISIINPALVRSSNTALQKQNVSKTIDRFDYYTQQQVNSATSIRDRNKTLVDILWGICKYLLFVGLGWPLIPLMLAMQYIMSFNYIHTNLPLNLNYFLTSFRDFRNPSIFYNPLRNQIDTQWVNHGQIYKRVPQFYEFDRGLDFVKNCFQFFFVPILAFALLGLLFLFNKFILNKCCRKDVGLISKYLVPRAGLLAGAYTLVQALPVSFFYFAQITDTTIHHPKAPSGAYPTFNTALAYLAFFITCTIPLMILAGTYYAYNYGSRITKFSDANRFNKNFLQKIQNQPTKLNRADMDHPIWGGNTVRPSSYAFGLAVFALPIIFGFFLAYFIKSYPWQLTGIIFATALFLCFAAAATHFSNIIFKIFFIVFALLMLAYLLLHAGIGSNRAIGTYDQWNTGYLGIGLIYAMLLSAILFSAYFLYKSLRGIYNNHLKNGFWQDIDKKHDQPVQEEAKRVTQYRRDTKLKSTFLKNPTVIGNNNYSSKVNIPLKSVNDIDEDNLHSEDRMIIRYSQPKDSMQRLNLTEQNPYKRITTFRSDDNMIFTFPQNIAKSLLLRQPLWIDSENRIYDRDRNFIDYYNNLNRQQEPVRQQRKQVIQLPSNRQPQNSNVIRQTQTTRRVVQLPETNLTGTSTRRIINQDVYIINNQKFVKQGQDQEGNLYLRNPITNQKRTINLNKFKKGPSQSLLQYNSNSNIKIQQTNYNPPNTTIYSNQKITTTSHKVIYANRHLIRNGQEYVDLGYDGKDFKLLNLRTNQIQKLSRQEYVRANQDSALKRLNINDEQYDYQGTDFSGKVYFLNKQGHKIALTKEEFQKLKQEHLRKFYRDLDEEMKKGEEKKIIYYNGEPYEQLGMDANGNHRLFNLNTKNYLLLPNSQYTRLYGKLRQSQANLLLLQSAVGQHKKSDNSFKEQEQMHLEDQTDRYFIFSQEKGSKIYVPKSRINLDQPLQIDQFNNFRQNGKVILTKQQSKAIERAQFSNQKRNSLQKIQMTSQRRVQAPKRDILQKEQVQADDVINPSNYYKILGIPSDKVSEQFDYKQNDIFLTQRNIKGSDVMRRVQNIQSKYPNLTMLVKGQSNQNEEYWMG